MRTVRFALCTFLAACSTSTAWAQYGLYGSPETLSVPQQQATQPYAAPANYPTTATPMAQPAPTPAYYPASHAGVLSGRRDVRRTIRRSRRIAIRRSRRPCTRRTAYQPYQPAAQYQYPVRPPVRTAAIEPPPTIQPMPTPPATARRDRCGCPPGRPGAARLGHDEPDAGRTGPTRGCYGGDNGCGGAYRGAVGRYEQSACGQDYGYDGSCGQGYYAARGTPPSPHW